MANERLTFLDAVKGVAVLCIVLPYFKDGVCFGPFNVFMTDGLGGHGFNEKWCFVSGKSR
ncbi:MAG: hypothetical protein MJ016_00640 [Victivallaceae bacterium]|nr:hypothetical protein [Victivallaceae bacterium]